MKTLIEEKLTNEWVQFNQIFKYLTSGPGLFVTVPLALLVYTLLLIVTQKLQEALGLLLLDLTELLASPYPAYEQTYCYMLWLANAISHPLITVALVPGALFLGYRTFSEKAREQLEARVKRLTAENLNLTKQFAKAKHVIKLNEDEMKEATESTYTYNSTMLLHKPCVINGRPYRQVMPRGPDLVFYDEDDVMCTICLGEYDAADVVIDLPCQHKFHTQCLLDHHDYNFTCPRCTRKLQWTFELA